MSHGSVCFCAANLHLWYLMGTFGVNAVGHPAYSIVPGTRAPPVPEEGGTYGWNVVNSVDRSGVRPKRPSPRQPLTVNTAR